MTLVAPLALLTGAVAALALALGLFRRAWRRAWRRAGRHALHVDAPPGVVDERFVPLGGVEQWVSVRGERTGNPVLLVLHGGPGMSYTIFTPDLRPWERHFTVVQWDRRGVGRTLGRSGAAGCGELSLARMQADCVELCAWLKERLPGAPLVLLSSSAGTLVGLPLAHRRPDLFAAYVGVDFNPGLAACEAIAGPATLAWAREHGRRGDVAFLEGMGLDPARWTAARYDRLMRLRDRAAGSGRGVGAVCLPRMLRSPTHSLRDLRDLARGLSLCGDRLFPEMAAFDARAVAPRLDLPFHVFQGSEDIFTPPAAAEAYVREVAAATKRFALIPGAGHLGGFARPALLLELLLRHLGPLR